MRSGSAAVILPQAGRTSGSGLAEAKKIESRRRPAAGARFPAIARRTGGVSDRQKPSSGSGLLLETRILLTSTSPKRVPVTAQTKEGEPRSGTSSIRS